MSSSTDDEFLGGVAVVGLAGRFPGASSVQELWENLKAGRESVTRFTASELAEEGVPAHLIDDPSYVPVRGLLDRPEFFDAGFFGIAPREAELMDPQHRLFLETCWHALESAGYAPSQIDAPVGVWGGMSTGMSNDTYLHSNLGGPKGVPEEDVLPAMLGNENDYLTTRVSYKLNLRGPSVNVQTACSTSLMAIVQAFQSLMTYGCDMAVAGGVSVSYPQRAGYLHQEGGIGSPDGHCRPFDAEARGTVFSNGVGAVVLKRLDEAKADGDPILAVIRGVASNNDGAAKMSFAAPSVEGQAEVVATALAVADVDPASVTYVETHGTGTPIGDPIEVAGLTQAFRRSTDETGFCALGSIKSNFGHLDSAAGVAGFIKAVLSLHHRTLVPTVHFETPSPRIDWAGSPFFVNTDTRPWETDRLPRRAGVSAFGIGGTNAHVILEEAPGRRPLPAGTGPQLLPLSARTPDALAEAMAGMDGHLGRHPELRLADVAHTLQVGRSSFRERAAVVAEDLTEARALLGARDRSGIVWGRAQAVEGCVFLFPGGGAQYVGMGRGLYDVLPEFRAEVEHGLRLLREREGVDLRPIWLDAPDSRSVTEAFQRPSMQLPALFILEMALAHQLMRWGFEPTALIGHSMGENTAACLAGVLDYADALGLVALRGRLFDSAAPGGMLSVTASSEVLEPYLGADLDLAAINGPEQCTVSGPRGALDALVIRLEEAGIDARAVPIDIAAHSSLVDPLMEPFEAYLRGVPLKPPKIPFLSNRSGTWITDTEAMDPGYWARHLRGTVRFADDVRTVLQSGNPFFLEVGPGKILSSLVKLADPAVAPRVSATMRHPSEETSDFRALLASVGRVWTAGGAVDWAAIRGDTEVRRVALPGYPFQRKPFLVQPPAARDAGSGSRSGMTASATPATRASDPSAPRVPGAAPAAASPGEAAPGAAPLPNVATPSAGSGGIDAAALRRVLELQIQTNAAVQSLLTGALAARALGGSTEAPAPDLPAGTRDAAQGETSELEEESPTGQGIAAVTQSVPEVVSGLGVAAGAESVSDASPPHRPAPVAEPTPPKSRPDEGAQRDFWRESLHAPLPVLEWMTDSLRLPGGLENRAALHRPLPPSVFAGVQRLAVSREVDAEAVILAAFAATLHKQTGQESFVVGVSACGFEADEGGQTLPLPVLLRAEESFETLVGRVAAGLSEARRHGDLSFQELVDIADVPTDPTRAPLLQTRFRTGSAAEGIGPPWPGQVPLDLDVRISDGDGGAQVAIEYASGLYRRETVEDLSHHLQALLSAAVEVPGSEVASLPAVAPGVFDRIDGWNDSAVPVPPVESLAGWLTADWAARGERVAVIAQDGELTYRALSERSDRLAQHLVASGVTPGSLVGLCLERTSDLLVASIAVWKAGAGYVPLDPTYPAARLALMARRADLSVLVTTQELTHVVPDDQGRRVLLDREAGAIAARPPVPPTVAQDLANPAYVLFTSGSTGEPKGVQVPARSVVNLLEAMARRPGFHEEDVLLAVTTLSFDISILELFLPLRVGGQVVLATSSEAMDGQALVRLLDRHPVTLLQSTPSTFRLLLSAGWAGRDGLRIICCGEPFPRDLLRELLPRVSEVWNGYGPTEATVFASFARLTDADAPITIGTPVENTRLYVLDEEGHPVGPGVQGELHIAGLGVADGYLGRPEETAARFLPDPFGPAGSRMYRTGDAVRWRRDGELEHLARMDQQVKVRGFRIELGEIEATLASCEGVRGAAVVLRSEDGVPELAGYVATDEGSWGERALRETVGERLPAYMIPRFLVRLDGLPLTENGKIDRKRLPDPRDGAGWAVEVEEVTDETSPDVDEGELYLRQVWEEILEIPDVRSDDNFFDLGGHSLLAVRAIARVREERGVDIALRALMAGTLGVVAREYLGERPEPGAIEGANGSKPGAEGDDGAVSRVLGTMRGWISR